jgi:NAD dependent epimerase/dehydratase family enzyme
MKNKTIIIAGGTGFIGQEMIKYFSKENKVIVLTRQLIDSKNNRNHYNSLKGYDLQNVSFIKWDAKTIGEWVTALEESDLLINLAGKTVNCRYNEKNKQEILNSRVDAVKVLGAAIRQCSAPPECWINASSATIYRHALDGPQDEYTSEFHEGFSVNVCQQWEKVFMNKPYLQRVR